MKRFFALFAAVAFCGAGSAFAQTTGGGVPASAECSIDICVAQDVAIECIETGEYEPCVEMLIGQEEELCQTFHITGGGGMNIEVDWRIDSDDESVAVVNDGDAEYADNNTFTGSTTQAGTPNMDGNPSGIYTTNLSGTDATVGGDSWLRLCADVEAVGAGTASIVYHATVTDYGF